MPVPLPRVFDYLPPVSGDIPAIGSRVVVPFGRRHLVGLVLSQKAPEYDKSLKYIEATLDLGLISEPLLQLARWCAQYYCFAPGELVSLLLPTALRQSKPFRPQTPEAWALTDAGKTAELKRAPRKRELRQLLLPGPLKKSELEDQNFSDALIRQMHQADLIEPVHPAEQWPPTPGPDLNEEQRIATARVLRSRRRFGAFLLAGVTGSGKTEVYLQLARRLIQRAGQVLVLVPEIGLTPQLVRRFESRLGQRAWTYHSGLSAGERLACWQAAKDGRAQLIIGTRSSVFLPLPELALIVVDEEHDGSFKQQEGARYHGRDVAVLRAQRQNVPVILGSATPALESIHNVKLKRYRLLTLTQRAGAAVPPKWHLLDQRKTDGPLHPELVQHVERHLSTSGQVLLYRNRRGYAPILMCNACGWSAECDRCSAHMTWHQIGSRLQCHHCGASRRQPRRCPDCGDPTLLPLGAGTERLESLLQARFPETPVHRVDRDQLSGKHDFETLLEQVRDSGPCILVGTQMLAKGHHLPNVTLAAVLDVDAALFSADFRAPERLGQAVHQVAGRAGRTDRAGEFYLQTRHTEHALLSTLLQQNYLDYADGLLEERTLAGLPPSTGLALLRAESHQAESAKTFLKQASSIIYCPELKVSGPVPAVMSKRGGYWRFQLWVQADEKRVVAERLGNCLEHLHALPAARNVRWHVDMDPLEI
mgnify:CR=1 FL=1